ncbi:MAG: hypothetical protein C0613_09210 [Desulfobulbaceae bacterium]|nr:MAG: hypothetical protein C0613_09210 [Desulfobulbaceae bacterium]
MSKKFFFLCSFLFCLTAPLQANVLTIDREPAELTAMRSAYEQQMKDVATPEKMAELKSEYESSKKESLQAPVLTKQIASLENARDLEIRKIEQRYNARINALRKEALAKVERKYQTLFDSYKNKNARQIKNQYIMDLKTLEDKLIRQNNLAGALVVQTERNKMMGLSSPGTGAAKTAEKKAPARPAAAVAPAPKASPAAPKARSAGKAKTEKVTAPTRQASAAKPLIYANDSKGIAGSGNNVKNNVYSFAIEQFGEHAWLSFNGYGRETNNSYGEVYLVTPSGQRHQVTSWSPDQLQATNFYGVNGADDVRPIKTDISSLVNSKGAYKVEFLYRDGNEPLNIYHVEIKTW